jgi:hypothetical protein
MKKIMISFLLVVTSSVITRAQVVYHAYKGGFTNFNRALNEWGFDPQRPMYLNYALRGRVLAVDDRKRSTYIPGEEYENSVYEDCSTLGYDAIDEDGRKCSVHFLFMKYGPVRIQLSIL